MKFEAPQMCMVMIFLIGLFGAGYNHGKLKESAPTTLKLLATFIQIGLMYWGDFFKQIQLPQIIYFVLFGVNFIFIGYNHGKFKLEKENVFIDLISFSLFGILLIWGGFFSF